MVAAPTMPSSTLAESLINDVAVKRPHDVVEQSTHSGRKTLLLALLRVISLDHSNAAERFGQPPGDLGVDLAALAKNRTDRRETPYSSTIAKQAERTDRHQCQRDADAKQQDERDAGRD